MQPGGIFGFIKAVKPELWKYLRERVAVRAFGVEYTGIFKGADEDWVFLQTETTWVQIPWLEISSFQPAPVKETSRIQDKTPGEPGPGEKQGRRDRHLETDLKLLKGEKDQGEGEPLENGSSPKPENKKN